MNKFVLIYSEQAKNDIDELTNTIIYQYKAPTTAFNYVQGLVNEINSLKNSADIFPIQTNSYVIRTHGYFVRRINYKKMAIFFTINRNIVYILRIIPQSLISEL